jgi:hypothetical protein
MRMDLYSHLSHVMNRILLAVAATALVGACASNAPVAVQPEPAQPPSAAERYATLPDTSVCVVDRTTRRGLRPLAAKVDPDGKVVVLVAERVLGLDELHPVEAAAGYAANEHWVTVGEPINLLDRRYEKVGPERLIPLEQLERAGEFRAIPVFADPSDPAPPRAVYLPMRPGCVFQAYVRSDLLR